MNKYIAIIKPGIVLGNALTLIGGCALGGYHNCYFSYYNMVYSVFSMMLIISWACLLNNYLEKDIDLLMQRTKKRSVIWKFITKRYFYLYSISLAFIGFFTLYVKINYLANSIALLSSFLYVIVYTLIVKKRTTLSTIIGAIPGACPIIIGYSSTINSINHITIILFLIVFFWQIPHFFSIAFIHKKDYRNARIPTFPMSRGKYQTNFNILILIGAYSLLTTVLNIVEIKNNTYLYGTLFMNIVWLLFSIQGFFTTNSIRWAKRMLSISIVNITVFNTMIIYICMIAC